MESTSERQPVKKTLRVSVLDDDASARDLLVGCLREEPGIEVVDAFRSGRRTVSTLRKLQPDICFLDVELRFMDGFEVLSALNQRQPPRVVFVTASPEHAVRAFELGAVDYLLKPPDAARIGEALRRARLALGTQPGNDRIVASIERLLQRKSTAPSANGSSNGYNERLMISERGRFYFLKVSEIDWIEAVDNYVRIHAGRETHLIRQTLSGLYAQLDPVRFARIHRSTIVNLDRIREIQLGIGRDRIVVLVSGMHLRLSEGYRRELERRTRAGAC